MPAPALREAPRRKVLSWPTMTWALAAAAALLVVGVIAYNAVSRRDAGSQTAKSQPEPAPAQTTAPQAQPGPPAVTASSLADLALPAFVAPNLRGDNEDAAFQTGMKAYAGGDCTAAVAELAKVAAESRDLKAAEFYRGACEMHGGDLKAAAATLRKVADAGDSAEQESALYYLAQVELANNDAAAAHRTLQRTIALRGDLEQKASAQDRRIAEMLHGSAQPSTR